MILIVQAGCSVVIILEEMEMRWNRVCSFHVISSFIYSILGWIYIFIRQWSVPVSLSCLVQENKFYKAAQNVALSPKCAGYENDKNGSKINK